MRLNLDDAPELASASRDREMIAVDDALEMLAKVDPRGRLVASVSRRQPRSSNFAAKASCATGRRLGLGCWLNWRTEGQSFGHFGDNRAGQ